MREQNREVLIKDNIRLEKELFPIIRPIIPDEWSNLDLTMLQFKILLLLYSNDVMRIGEIASSTGVSVAAMTGITDRLSNKGLLIREHSIEDRRVINCSLTDEGNYLVNLLWETSKDRWQIIMDKMTLYNLGVFNKALKAILAAAEGIDWDTQV
jgi:DNA-binding MarR family transcriptional regulator